MYVVVYPTPIAKITQTRRLDHLIARGYDPSACSTNDGVGQDAVTDFKPGSRADYRIGATLTCVSAVS